MSLPLILLLTLVPSCVLSHGRLREPPSRSSMWRDGFNNPRNYNDNELYCGSFNYQVKLGGKCGVCGDPWDKPREHEAGGKYANGIITRKYEQGGILDVAIQITAHHKGYFEFRLCPNNNPKIPVTEECLNKHLLPLADGSGTRYMLPNSGNIYYNMSLVLPPDVTCTQCMLQWKYNAGNSWGVGKDGIGCTGCGQQEQFYGCADIAITTNKPRPKYDDKSTTENPATKQPTTATKQPTRATKQPSTATKQPSTATKQPSTATKQPSTATKQPTTATKQPTTATKQPTTATKQPTTATKQPTTATGPTTTTTDATKKTTSPRRMPCKATDRYKKIPAIDVWCQINCPLGFCPKTHCVCKERKTLPEIISTIPAGSNTVLPPGTTIVSKGTVGTSGSTAKPTGTNTGTAGPSGGTAKPTGTSTGTARPSGGTAKPTGTNTGTARPSGGTAKPTGTNTGAARPSGGTAKPTGTNTGTARPSGSTAKPTGTRTDAGRTSRSTHLPLDVMSH